MKSWWIRSAAGKTMLELRDVPVPEPKPGELRVRLRSAGLNRGELIAARALESAAKPLGSEGAGEIDKLGADVAGFAVGERVMGRCSAAFSEFGILDAREAVRVPAGLSWEEAGGIPLAFLVVHDMLIAQGRLKAGEWLLVTGISAGVGVAALQTGKALGAKVIGTSGSQAKLERLKALGLDLGIRTRAPDFARAVIEATGGRGADLIVNNVGGSVFSECVRALAFQGRLATVGYLDGVLKAEIDIEALHTKRLVLFGVSNKLRTAKQRAETVRGFENDILPFIASGRIRPLIDRVFPFTELPAAKDYMESDAHLGKIVVTMP